VPTTLNSRSVRPFVVMSFIAQLLLISVAASSTARTILS